MSESMIKEALQNSHDPHFGWTSLGHPVHKGIIDYLPNHTRWNRLNQRVAVKINELVFNMNTFWVFNFLALCSLPAVLTGVHLIPRGLFPAWLISASFVAMIAWIAQTYIQLVLLPAIGVNQNLQAAASDARAIKTFEDTERLVSLLDPETEGGIACLNAKLDRILEMLGDDVVGSGGREN